MRGPAHPDAWSTESGGRRVSPSAERNAEAIAAVLAQVMPETGRALELASGSGQHIAGFARRWPGVRFQPSDANPDTFASIRAWRDGLANLSDPVLIDASRPGWASVHGGQDLIWLVNLLHLISTPEAETVLAEAAQALAAAGVVCVYGPFRRDGVLISEGDRAFDARLRATDPAIGYKEAAWVEDQLRAAGLTLDQRVDMPANNLMLVARRI